LERLAIEEQDNQRTIREKIVGRLLTLEEGLRSTVPAFLSLLEVPAEDSQWEALDPSRRRQMTLDAVKVLLLRETREQPLCVVVEDLHWIDSETQATLDNLIESLPTTQLLLLVNYRPEYQHVWGNKTYYTQLRIDPLPPESAQELLHSLLGDSAELTPLKSLLTERAEGNPFFLEESVRTLLETQVLVSERGTYRVGKPLESITVPATVQALLAARIDRLPPEQKRLLQVAAVLGKDVPFALLKAIAEEPEDDLRRSLTRLQAAEFIYETRLFPELEYTFKHALTHEVAYGSLLHERRRALHARILETIESVFGNRIEEQVERLASHSFRGEVWEKAVGYLRQAGAKAAVRAANREAVAFQEQALVALQHLPESDDRITQAIDLRIDLRQSLYPLGELGKILNYLGEAETLAKALGDQHRLGWISVYMLNHFFMTGSQDRAVENGQRALAVGEALADIALQVEASYRLGQAYWALGDYREAITCFGRNVECLKEDLIRERFGMPGLPSVNSRAWLIWCLAERGEFAQGRERGNDVVHLAEALAKTTDHPFSLSTAYWGVGHLNLRQGELSAAIPALEHSLEICRAWNIRLLFPWFASPLGYAYALAGRISEGLPLLEQAVEQGASMRQTVGQSLWTSQLSEAYLLDGRIDEATDLARRALELSREGKAWSQRAWALRILGDITSQSEPPEVDNAEEHYREALALAEELGMRPLIAHCHLGLGRLCQKTGSISHKANEHLTAAVALYREMGMLYWLEPAEVELEELRSN